MCIPWFQACSIYNFQGRLRISHSLLYTLVRNNCKQYRYYLPGLILHCSIHNEVHCTDCKSLLELCYRLSFCLTDRNLQHKTHICPCRSTCYSSQHTSQLFLFLHLENTRFLRYGSVRSLDHRIANNYQHTPGSSGRRLACSLLHKRCICFCHKCRHSTTYNWKDKAHK